MTFFETVTWDYIFIVALSFALVVAVIYYRLFISDHPDRDSDDNDDRGGMSREPKDPILDLPFGVVTQDEFEKERKEESELAMA